MSKFKTGDTVYSIFEGLGTIVEIQEDAFYPIIVSFARGIGTSYTEKGKSVKHFLNPDLITLEEARAKGYDVPIQKLKMRRWLNLDSDGLITIFSTKRLADDFRTHRRIECRLIEWEVKE